MSPDVIAETLALLISPVMSGGRVLNDRASCSPVHPVVSDMGPGVPALLQAEDEG